MNHYNFVTHGGNVCTASGATSEYNGNLGDALCAHPSLIVKYPTKIILVGEHVVLLGQEGTR